MEDYKIMYYKLFNQITDIIIELQELQTDAESQYIAMGMDNKVVQIPKQTETRDIKRQTAKKNDIPGHADAQQQTAQKLRYFNEVIDTK